MNRHPVRAFATFAIATLLLVESTKAQSRPPATREPSLPQHYGIHNAYDGTTLHPDGRRSTAVPVTMDDGRTGEFVIPASKSDPHPAYYRDDQTGDLHPVRMDPHATRQQVVQAPHAVRYETEPQHTHKASWEQDALIVGGSAGAGALIGAAAGGKKGAGVGAAAGGIGGLIYDLVSQNKR